MRTRKPTNTGPFLKRVYWKSHVIEKICSDALKGVELWPNEPKAIRIDRFIEEMWEFSEQYAKLPDGYLGCAKFNEYGICGIFVNQELESDPSTPAKRKLRSTLGHEAGHGLLHASLYSEKISMQKIQGEFIEESDQCENGILCRESSIANEEAIVKPDWWEVQSNMAMASLLLPLSLVLPVAREQLPRLLRVSSSFQEVIMREIESEIAEIFDVNPIMVQYRLKEWWEEQLVQPELI